MRRLVYTRTAKQFMMKYKYLSLLILIAIPFFISAQHFCSDHKQRTFIQAKELQQNFKVTNTQMELMEKYDITFHHLNLQVERTNTQIVGNVRTIAKVKSPIDTFAFQLHHALQVDSIVGIQSLSFSRDSSVVYVFLEKTYQANEVLNIVIYYRGTPPASQSAAIGAGFSNAASPTYSNRITWSLSQPYSAYEWWPCKQSLQDKIDSIKCYITTDTSNKAGSNGLLKQVTNLGNGKHRYEWESKYPISYYLISVAVGQYNEYLYWAKPKQLVDDSIPVVNYIYSNPLAFTNNRTSIEATVPQLEMFSNIFGLYPFHEEKYGHAMAPFSGGMEHQTMTSQGIFNFDIVAHELAHQWFGDHVTCANWSDLWLNEGFATYSEYLANEKLRTPTQRMNKLTNIQNAAKNTSNSVWVDDTTNVSRIFNSNSTYQKGAAIIHVLRYLFQNDSTFFAMLTDYQQRYAMGIANALQFKTVAETHLGKSLNAYFDQWYYGKGFPVFTAKWNQQSNKAYFILSQSNALTSVSNFFTLPIPVVFKSNQGDTTMYLTMKNTTDTFQFNLSQPINTIEIDPQSWLLRTVGTIVKDETIYSALHDIDEPLQVNIFPNPVKEEVTIQSFSNLNGALVEVIDITGKKLQMKVVNEMSHRLTIPFKDLKPGIYFIHVQLNGKSQTLKLMKQ
jgi:aminopeptidase N